ncbi:uncharacterized protein BDZ83DRAFT_774021 [Colletotrichum acutatum]|uniref:Uncharacterized protein n=1 Tax=Glomerella acutata TaxID=27357 RepID=A0AAD8UQP8_GLOAC|nr:uncharacterized protein BDZ83DRAFT_774021 [Colletotrichum acutatum]KAK1726575.1 hypothetical protein BDZ83DRAFT_774021 [Colletotrichum acutatum]
MNGRSKEIPVKHDLERKVHVYGVRAPYFACVMQTPRSDGSLRKGMQGTNRNMSWPREQRAVDFVLDLQRMVSYVDDTNNFKWSQQATRFRTTRFGAVLMRKMQPHSILCTERRQKTRSRKATTVLSVLFEQGLVSVRYLPYVSVPPLSSQTSAPCFTDNDTDACSLVIRESRPTSPVRLPPTLRRQDHPKSKVPESQPLSRPDIQARTSVAGNMRLAVKRPLRRRRPGFVSLQLGMDPSRIRPGDKTTLNLTRPRLSPRADKVFLVKTAILSSTDSAQENRRLSQSAKPPLLDLPSTFQSRSIWPTAWAGANVQKTV